MMRGKIANLLGPYLPVLHPTKIVFYGQCITLGASCLYVLPIELAGLGAQKRMFYTLAMWSCILTAMFTIKANYGVPTMPQGLSFSIAAIKQAMASNVQPWLQKVMLQSKDFSWLFFALIFLTAYPSVVPLVLVARRSLWSVCNYCDKPANNMANNFVWRKFEPIWKAKLEPNTKEVNLYSAQGEIGLGFFLVVSMFLPTRQMLLTLLYWNYLTTRYKIPAFEGNQQVPNLHEKAWKSIGQKVEPLLKMAPFLNPIIEKAKGYFKGP